ncbi:MAG TPA: hypothetical protein VFH72_10150 [Candidatus Baltobacteraceae bacterium]|jgi:hypothetical protein|nr:hypothetical protein [Candidatus Baltobacteraceae bacterium]
MNDDQKAKMQEAIKQTQVQAEEAASQLGAFLRVGAQKLKEAADKAKEAIQNDINSRS